MGQHNLEFIKSCIFQKLGRPPNPTNEKLKIYKAWNGGGFIRGRFSCVSGETIYSYFLVEKDGIVSVYHTKKVSEEPDMVINIREKAEV